MSTTQISITLDKNTLEKLDNKRGLVPRSRAIQFLISNSLDKKEKGMANPFSQSSRKTHSLKEVS